MIKLDLQQGTARAAMMAVVVVGSLFFVSRAFAYFVTATVSDNTIPVSREVIEIAADYYPDSSRVQARLAARLIESGVSETESHERTAKLAINHASRAVSLSPWSYELRELLAAAREMNGDLEGAESDLREAIKLAPHNTNVRWRLANLLVRNGKLDPALSEFRQITAADPARLVPTLNLVWQASGGDLKAVDQVAGNEPKARVALAHMLVQQSQAEAAADIFGRLDRQARLALVESGQFIDSLIVAGQVELAAELWRRTVSDDGHVDRGPIWNGSFEIPSRKGFSQFDWKINSNKYARIGFTAETAHSGQHSLKIAYSGIETTRLDNALHQAVSVRPGTQYRLECYVKTDKLVTPDGPQIIVMSPTSSTPIAASTPVVTGSHDWQPLAVDFTAPEDARTLNLSIRQRPQFSFVDPTTGTVWFDDFVMNER